MVCPSSARCKQGLPFNLPPTIWDQRARLGHRRVSDNAVRYPAACASVPPDPTHGMSPRFRLARLAFCRGVASMFAAMLRSLPPGFIAPCLPTKADTLPSGEMWLHEIKHDGFRVIARKDGDRVRLYMKREEEEDWRRRRT